MGKVRKPGFPHPAFVQCQKLMDAKGDDYSGGAGQDYSLREYHPYGDISYLQMLNVKFHRIEAMVKKKQEGKEVKFDSLKDSVEDLINYAAFFWAFLDEERNNSRD